MTELLSKHNLLIWCSCWLFFVPLCVTDFISKLVFIQNERKLICSLLLNILMRLQFLLHLVKKSLCVSPHTYTFGLKTNYSKLQFTFIIMLILYSYMILTRVVVGMYYYKLFKLKTKYNFSHVFKTKSVHVYSQLIKIEIKSHFQ